MKRYTIDLDIFKQIFGCKGVSVISYRISANKGGLHILWYCDKKWCKHCSKIKKLYDDKTRYKADMKNRKPYERDILWDMKGKNKATLWKTFKNPESNI
jgi:hypothetical protein